MVLVPDSGKAAHNLTVQVSLQRTADASRAGTADSLSQEKGDLGDAHIDVGLLAASCSPIDPACDGKPF